MLSHPLHWEKMPLVTVHVHQHIDCREEEAGGAGGDAGVAQTVQRLVHLQSEQVEREAKSQQAQRRDRPLYYSVVVLLEVHNDMPNLEPDQAGHDCHQGAEEAFGIEGGFAPRRSVGRKRPVARGVDAALLQVPKRWERERLPYMSRCRDIAHCIPKPQFSEQDILNIAIFQHPLSV